MAKRNGKRPHRTATRRPDLQVVRDLEVVAHPAPVRSSNDIELIAALEESSLPDDVKASLGVVADPDAGPEQAVTAIAAGVLHDIGECRRPLEVEELISALLGLVAREATGAADGAEVEAAQQGLLTDLIEAFARAGGPAGLAGLRGLAAIGPPATRAWAGREADRLAGDGLPEPRWAAAIGRPAFVRAWRYGDVFGSQTSVGLLFDYARREHALLVLIDHTLGGGVKDCFIAHGRDATGLRTKVAAQMATLPTAFFEDVDAAEAARELSQALAERPCPVQDDQVEDVARYLALLRSRTALLAERAGLPAPGAAAGGEEGSISGAGPGPVLTVKVSLAGIRPPIWRRLEVPGDLTLGQLHVVLQTAFGWEGEHLHAFEIPPPERVRRQLPGARPEALPAAAEAGTWVGQLLREVGDELIYRYDFGDDWEHRIVVEASTAPEDGVAYPRCTGGRRNAPPEDCGGVPGYEHLVSVLADPSHPEHRQLTEWAPAGFDPAAFSWRAVDAALSTLRPG